MLDRPDEPLAAGDDLDGPLALLEELDRPRHRLGLADQVARLAQQLDDRAARLVDRPPGQLAIARARALEVLRLPARAAPGHLGEAAVGAQHRAHGQAQLAPPHHVGEVAERAHHHQARALVGLDQRMGEHGHARAEQRRQRLAADEPALALVVGVGEQRHARGDQLGAGRLDQVTAPPSGADLRPAAPEAHAVHRARALAVLELGLGDGGLEVDVPQRRRLQLVGLAAGEQPEERALGDPLGERADRRVGHRPVDRQAEPAPQRLEHLLVALGQAQAQLDEVRPRHRHRLLLGGLGGRREVGVVGDRRVAAHAEVVLHAPLGRQAVVVPAHRVEDRLAAHPLVAGDGVGVRVGEDVPDVQRAADGRRRGVDREHPLARGAARSKR